MQTRIKIMNLNRSIYKMHENEKTRLYKERVIEAEHGTFTPLVFTTTGGVWEKDAAADFS